MPIERLPVIHASSSGRHGPQYEQLPHYATLRSDTGSCCGTDEDTGVESDISLGEIGLKVVDLHQAAKEFQGLAERVYDAYSPVMHKIETTFQTEPADQPSSKTALGIELDEIIHELKDTVAFLVAIVEASEL